MKLVLKIKKYIYQLDKQANLLQSRLADKDKILSFNTIF